MRAFLLLLLASPAAYACNWPSQVSNWAQFAAACRACGGVPRVGAICDTRGGGGGYIPPSPAPEVLALQRANARYTQLIQDLPGDLIDRDAWLSSDRATADQFASTATDLFALMNKEITSYWNSANQWQNIAKYFDAVEALYPPRAAALKSVITEYSGYERGDEAWATRLDMSYFLRARTSDELAQRTDQLRLQMEGDRQVVSDVFTVMLPPSLVMVNEDEANRRILHWPTYLSFPTNSFPSPAVPTVVLPAVAAFELPPLATAVAVATPEYAPFSDAPENIASTLEATASRLNQVYAAWSEISVRETARKAGIAREVAELQTLSQKSQQVCGLAVSMNAHLRDLLDKTETQDADYQSSVSRFAMQSLEGLIWRESKRVVMQTIRDEYREVLTGTLDLTDQETFDHYANREGNIFSLPDTALHAVRMKALQNNILALLEHGTDYATTAARLLAQGTPSEIQEFAGQLFDGMSADSTKLVKSGLTAANLPFPLNTLLARYIVANAQNDPPNNPPNNP